MPPSSSESKSHVSEGPGHALDPDQLQALLERIHRIPCVQAFSFQVDRLETGACYATMPRDSGYDGIFESFHGGLLMSAADMAACFAIMTLTGPDQVMTTTDMNIRFLGPCLTAVKIEARVIKLGKTLCPAAVNLFDTEGRLVAVAQVVYMRLDQMPSR